MRRWVRQLLCKHNATSTRVPALNVLRAVLSGRMTQEKYAAWKWEPCVTTCCGCGKEWHHDV